MPQPAKTTVGDIVYKAVSLYRQQGKAGLSMRQLASELGLSVSSLYYYFPDKEHLHEAVREAAAGLFIASLRQAMNKKKKKKALRALARAYIAFATENRELYTLLFSTQHMPLTENGQRQALWRLLQNQVASISKNPDDTASTLALWSMLHGYASLGQAGMLSWAGKDTSKKFHLVLEDWLKGMAQS